MKGWKTLTGAALLAIGGALKVFGPVLPGEIASIATLLETLGAALMGIGIAHKIERGPSV